MFHILSRPVYKLQKQTLWRCCLPTTFHCLRARRENFQVQQSSPLVHMKWLDPANKANNLIQFTWCEIRLKTQYSHNSSGWEWLKMVLDPSLDPTVQVTLARFAGDVDKCLEFLLDTEEGHFLGLTGQWSILSGRIQGQLNAFGGKRTLFWYV